MLQRTAVRKAVIFDFELSVNLKPVHLFRSTLPDKNPNFDTKRIELGFLLFARKRLENRAFTVFGNCALMDGLS